MAEGAHQEAIREEVILAEGVQKEVQIQTEVTLTKIKANVEEDNVFFKA